MDWEVALGAPDLASWGPSLCGHAKLCVSGAGAGFALGRSIFSLEVRPADETAAPTGKSALSRAAPGALCPRPRPPLWHRPGCWGAPPTVTLPTPAQGPPWVLSVRHGVHGGGPSAPSRGSPRLAQGLRARAHQCGLDADALGRLEGQREVPPLEEKPRDGRVSGPGRATSPPTPAALTAALGPPALTAVQ